MTVRVLYFASLKDYAGAAEETIEIAETENVAALWAALQRKHPRLASIAFRPMAACDLNYASWDSPLRGVSEVAFLPPVSGG